MRVINVWKTCDTCSKRNCRTTPSKNGICSKRIPIREGFPLKEMLNERSD